MGILNQRQMESNYKFQKSTYLDIINNKHTMSGMLKGKAANEVAIVVCNVAVLLC